MIPKIVHFVWVGTQEKPELVKNCIASWKKILPDYKIMEWGNDTLDKIDNKYVSQAFSAKKWAFVSDFIRLYALDKFGGFYFDSDLEITENIDKFRDNKFITGYEKYDDKILPFTAFMGAEQGSKIIKTLLAQYDGLSFINPDGTYNQMTNTLRVSNLFRDTYGVTEPYDGTQRTMLGDDGVIEPWWFFCTPEQGCENYSIHLFNGSWLDGWNRKQKLVFGKYSIARFRRQTTKTNIVPLAEHERILMKIKTGKHSFYALIKGK